MNERESREHLRKQKRTDGRQPWTVFMDPVKTGVGGEGGESGGKRVMHSLALDVAGVQPKHRGC